MEVVSKAASHNWQNFTDKQTVSLIENILSSHGRVMPHLDSIDKWPNIDGRVELQSENFDLLGRLDVQAKTLKTNELKISCPTSFLSSCELDPCLLLAVDNANKKIYWQYFDSTEVKKFSLKAGQAMKTISFDPKHYIDENEKTYIEEWVDLARKNQERRNNHDNLKDAYSSLSKRSNVAIGENHQDFKMLHLFLDELNSKLDNEFLSVKQKIYPSAWKLGLALYDYKDNTLSYTIYPIPLNKNDVQIKRVDEQLKNELNAQGLGFRAHFVENPIELKPRVYAFDLIESYTMNLVEKRLFDQGSNELVSSEYIFHVIDVCKDSMKLKPQDSYNAKELLSNQWINEHKNSIYMIYNAKQIHVSRFYQLLEKYSSHNHIVHRPYKQYDFARGGGWVWNLYSKEDAEKIFLKVINAWPSAYDDLLNSSFPLLKDKLSLWGDANLMLVKSNLEERYYDHTGPTYETYLLNSKNSNTTFKRIELVPDELLDQLHDFSRMKEPILFEGQIYTLLSASHSMLDFIFHDLPLSNLVYETLERRLKDYFSKGVI